MRLNKVKFYKSYDVNFSIQNFGSIKNRQSVSFEADETTHLEEAYVVNAGGTRLLKLALIYGPNASGKTTVLKALDFLRELVLQPVEKKTNDYYKNYQEVLGELRVHLRGYEKTRRYFMRPGMDIYGRLKPYLKDAIRNAGELGEFDEQNPTKANCEMDVLFKN